MIKNTSDYRVYLEADRLALGRKKRFFKDDIWEFQILLRKTEYFANTKKSIIWKPYIFFLKWRLLSFGKKLGFTIPINCFGPGLNIAHYGTIVVNQHARIGRNCRIHVCVNIGTEAGFSDKAPRIGDDVYIGPGAKIFGNIRISDGIAIGANAVVNKSFAEPNITIAGVPAKKISDKGSKGMLVRAFTGFVY